MFSVMYEINFYILFKIISGFIGLDSESRCELCGEKKISYPTGSRTPALPSSYADSAPHETRVRVGATYSPVVNTDMRNHEAMWLGRAKGGPCLVVKLAHGWDSSSGRRRSWIT